jgi:phosphoserine phosphatase
LVGPIANALGIHEWHSSHYAVDHENRFSHISRIVQAEEKIAYLKQVAERLKIAPENATAYSDSILDLAFLQSAGKAIAVNPDRRLKKTAIEYGWEII